MKTAISLIVIVGIAWLVISPFAWGYRYIKGFDTGRDSGWGCVFAFGAFFACVYVLQEGIHSALAFLPDSWGSHDESGEYVPLRRSISSIGGLVGTLLLIDLLGRAERNRVKP